MDHWKGTSLCIGLLALALPLVVLPELIAVWFRSYHPVPEPLDTAAIGIVLALCAFLGLGRTLRIPRSDAFLRRPDRSSLRWTLFGVGLAAIVVAVPLVFVDGTLALRLGSWERALYALAIAALLAGWAAVLEEVLLRGYVLSIIGHQWNWPVGILVTSVVFGLLHNGHATDTMGTVLYVGTASLAGALFALVTCCTGNVWNAIAIHAVWNTAFSSHVLAISPGEPSSDALVLYALEAQPVLLGGGVSSVTESPFTMVVFAVAATAVFGYYGGWSR